MAQTFLDFGSNHKSNTMILQYLILNIFLITFVTQAAVLDHEPPVFTYCPNDFVKEDITTCFQVRVTWREPIATDNSGELPSLTSNRQPGQLFAVPSVSEVIYTAKDAAGNAGTCSFRITLKRKECPLYAPPKNGALACVKFGPDRTCAVMCKSAYDFVFNPPMLYFCSSGQWNFYSAPALPYQTQLPWPNCSDQASPSSLKTSGYHHHFFFSGDANTPNVEDVIKTNFISLMRSSVVPPFFCLLKPAECNKDTTEVYAGVFIDQAPPVFTYCPNDIVMDVTTLEIRVNWQEPTATDNSGVPPSVSLTTNRQSGSLFAVPGSYDVQYKAVDGAGFEAICNFRITLKRRECPLYAPPKNGALACVKIGPDRTCAVMCESAYDFAFNPPMLYFCSSGQWNFYTAPALPYQTQLPWPDCSDQANPSSLKTQGYHHFFFSGDANDPNVEDVIKTNFISLLKLPVVPPFFCLLKPAECNKEATEVYAGVFIG